MKLHRFVLLGIVALVGMLGLVGCGGEKVEIAKVSITAQDYSFGAPESIAGGLVELDLSNTGNESHHAQIAQLNAGVTMEQLGATMQQNPDAALGMLTLVGGPAPIPPGGKSEAVVDLKEGMHVLLCFVPSSDGLPHLAKGMVKPMMVTAPPATRPASPKPALTVNLRDYAFDYQGTIKKGESVLEVVNKGKEPHEMGVLKLKAPANEVLKMLTTPPTAGSPAPAGPPPFEESGGFQAVSPEGKGWTTLNLEAGDYALICFVPSPAQGGAPHVALGMFKPFTVS